LGSGGAAFCVSTKIQAPFRLKVTQAAQLPMFGVYGPASYLADPYTAMR
jgi:hypothetical protein